MSNNSASLRKAAVMIRSLDPETAAQLLGQLSPNEAAAVRKAIRALGEIDPDEQADIVQELRRPAATSKTAAANGVELELSSANSNADTKAALHEEEVGNFSGRRFDFLENAPTAALAAQLSREHAQTIAVVLSHLAPTRAATILAALPPQLQAKTIERLSALGETDAESVSALERELAAWYGRRVGSRSDRARRQDAVTSILSAADANTRAGIIANLKSQKSAVADLFVHVESKAELPLARARFVRPQHEETAGVTTDDSSSAPRPVRSIRRRPAFPKSAIAMLNFDQLVHLDASTLSAVMQEVNPNVLALALAASTQEMLERVCEQLPRKAAKALRNQLGQLGPTRLSDMEAAQRLIAQVASQHLARRRGGALAAV